MDHEVLPPSAVSRRRVLQHAAWGAPAIVLASAVPAHAATSGVTTTTIAVTTAHDYRSGQTPGVAPANANGAGGASRPNDNGSLGSRALYFVLRITNAGTLPLETGFAVTFDARASQPIARGTIDPAVAALWTGTPANAGANTEVVSYVYTGAPVLPGGHVDLVGTLDEVAGSPGNNDLPLNVMVGGSNIANLATGLYGAPNIGALALVAFKLTVPLTHLVTTSTYSGSNGSSFSLDTGLRAAYPAYYENHDAPLL